MPSAVVASAVQFAVVALALQSAAVAEVAAVDDVESLDVRISSGVNDDIEKIS